MRALEKYLMPFAGALMVIVPLYRDLAGTGFPGIGFEQLFLIVFGAAAIAIGLWFEIKPISWLFSTPRKDIARVAIITIVLLAVVDLTLGRIVPKLRIPTRYGWNFSPGKESKSIQDTKGRHRGISVEYFDHGFKRWPVSENGNPRVLIIGDSFTAIPYVSNGEEWYSYLEHEFRSLQFYVFGGFGYGTLQEYMVLDDRIDDIEPSAVIWQFCSNDYQNNYYELDRETYPLNNHWFRPYLEDDGIVYRLPLPFEKLRWISYIADRLLVMYDYRSKSKIQRTLREQGKTQFDYGNYRKSPHMRNAVEVTKTLLKKVRSRVGDKPIFFFNACGPFTEEDKAVCESARMNCINNIGDDIIAIENSGQNLRVANDGHWNFQGNKHAGRMLVGYFVKRGGIIKQ
jgi:hypothetical protein